MRTRHNRQTLGWFGSPYTARESLEWLRGYLSPRVRDLGTLIPLSRRRSGRGSRVARLVFLGDIMPPPNGRPPTVSPAIRSVLRSSDVVIGNLESTIGKDGSRGNRFGIHEQTLARVLEAFDVEPTQCCLSVANNHIADFGAAGISTTIEALQRLGVTPVGYMTPDGPADVRWSLGDVCVGLVAWTEWINRPPPDHPLTIMRSEDADRRFHDVMPDVDLTIAFPHWGYEFRHDPDPTQRATATALAARSIDLIVGHHAHVIQPAESIGGTLCFHGLGGFIQSRSVALRWPVRLGMLLVVDLCREAGDPPTIAYDIVPVVHEHRRDDHRLVCLSEASRADRRRMIPRFERLFPDP